MIEEDSIHVIYILGVIPLVFLDAQSRSFDMLIMHVSRGWTLAESSEERREGNYRLYLWKLLGFIGMVTMRWPAPYGAVTRPWAMAYLTRSMVVWRWSCSMILAL
jgi:hypothetical protein